MVAMAKKGIITHTEEFESREIAARVGEVAKKRFAHLIPHRLDMNTLIFIRRDRDIQEQVERYLKKLENDRKGY